MHYIFCICMHLLCVDKMTEFITHHTVIIHQLNFSYPQFQSFFFKLWPQQRKTHGLSLKQKTPKRPKENNEKRRENPKTREPTKAEPRASLEARASFTGPRTPPRRTSLSLTWWTEGATTRRGRGLGCVKCEAR